MSARGGGEMGSFRNSALKRQARAGLAAQGLQSQRSVTGGAKSGIRDEYCRPRRPRLQVMNAHAGGDLSQIC